MCTGGPVPRGFKCFMGVGDYVEGTYLNNPDTDHTFFFLFASVRLFGADDFLPMLTYVLVQCDMPQLDTEIMYMMELIDPPLLHGEGVFTLKVF